MCAGALSWCWAIAFRAKLWWWEGCNNQDDVFAMAVLALLITAGISSYLARRRRSSGHGRTALPPGPTGLPLLGSLPFLGGPDLHRSFAELAKAYGPVMSIRLGTKLCLVVSSPAAAKEVLKDHDANFANRDVPAAARVINYGGRGIGWNSSPASWRVLRKMTARELLNPSTVKEFYSLRRSEVRRMVREVHRRCGTPVRVGEESSLTSLDVITNMMWGSTVEGEERRRQVAKEFGEVVTEINYLLGALNLSDLIPALARFDLQGVERRMRRLHVLCDGILSKIMGMRVRVDVGRNGDGGEGRRISGGGGGSRGRRDFLQVMLEVVESTAEVPLTVDNLKAVMMDMVLAGGDTSAATVEWAMAEMMRNREILGKAQEELDRVVGKDAAVEESHLPSLRYLDAVVKETFRLHPVVPLLLPRCSGGPCLVGGHHVPSNTRVFVNVWAIHRDPSSWEDPLEFKPERFLGDDGSTKNWDYRGGGGGGGNGGFRFLPFGLGRRMCVGISLGERMTMFLLATLIHSLHWRLPAGEDVDMTEAFGLILRMARPLSLVPTPRDATAILLQSSSSTTRSGGGTGALPEKKPIASWSTAAVVVEKKMAISDLRLQAVLLALVVLATTVSAQAPGPAPKRVPYHSPGQRRRPPGCELDLHRRIRAPRCRGRRLLVVDLPLPARGSTRPTPDAPALGSALAPSPAPPSLLVALYFP